MPLLRIPSDYDGDMDDEEEEDIKLNFMVNFSRNFLCLNLRFLLVLQIIIFVCSHYPRVLSVKSNSHQEATR